MSALITHTLDEKLKILLVAELTKFSHLLVEKIEQQAVVEVILVSPAKFNLHDYENKDWYKVVLLFENSLTKHLSFLEEFCFLPSKTTAILPITTTIKLSETVDVSSWREQAENENELFKRITSNSDISGLIFYNDLIKENSELLSFFFSQLNKGLLVDPNIELKLQTIDELASILAIGLLKPIKKMSLIGGKVRISGNFLQEFKRLYLNQHQVNLPIKRVQLQATRHPSIKLINQFDQETTIEKTVDLVKQAVFFIPSLKKREVGLVNDDSSLKPPTKKSLIKTWNKTEFIHRKISLDLEHHLSKPTVIVETVAKTEEVIEEKTPINEEKQPEVVDSIFKDYRSQQKQQHLQKLTKSTKIGIQKLKNQKFLFGGGILITLIALTILASVIVFFMSISQVQGSLLSYLDSRTMPITAQQKKLVEMNKTVDNLEGKLDLLNKWFSMPFFSEASQLIEISRLIVSLQDQITEFEKVTAEFYQQVMLQKGTGSLELVNKESIEVFKTLSFLSAELKNYPLDKLSPDQARLISVYQELIAGQEKKINQLQQLSPLLPGLIAQEGTKTYALVLQNNQELRPTGGFIQAVAILTFKNGSLVNFQVEDVYTLDQQLKATISPPDEVKQYLGEERWYLRDSNWNPSFPETAERIKWFLEKSIAVKVDGVMGINLKVLEDVIGVLDQVEVDEYNEVLTKRNLDERMEFHSEVQLIETTQKRDYSELVLFKVLDRIQYLPVEQVAPLLSSLVKMADSKELLVAIFNEDAQSTFESLGWNGSIVEPACPTVFDDSECIIDSLMQVEANVGVNKANYYLERQIDHSIAVTSQQVSHKRVITFKNKAQTNAWPKGPYKSYVRFYLPEESVLKDIKINGQSIDTDKLTIRKELGKKIVGVLIEVAVKSELKLQLEYSLDHDQQTPFTYSFFDQKQPGARDISPRIFLNHDPDLSPVLIAPQAEVQGEVVVFSPSRDVGHVFVGVSFE